MKVSQTSYFEPQTFHNDLTTSFNLRHNYVKLFCDLATARSKSVRYSNLVKMNVGTNI